jgi:hypothetical protein
MSIFIIVAHDKHAGFLASMVSTNCIATVGDDLSGYSSGPQPLPSITNLAFILSNLPLARYFSTTIPVVITDIHTDCKALSSLKCCMISRFISIVAGASFHFFLPTLVTNK